MTEFAYPLPVIVICELLGVPPADRYMFMDWAHDFASRFEVEPLRTREMEERGDVATANLIEYFEELIEAKRSQPAGEVLTACGWSFPARWTGARLPTSPGQSRLGPIGVANRSKSFYPMR